MIDKRLIADSFSKAAASYDRAAHLQRVVGSQLISALDTGLQPQLVLDIGCGTGYFTRKLQQRYSNSVVVGLDIATGMLKFARQQDDSPILWLGADAERLPLAAQSVDFVFSSLALQWCSDLSAVFEDLWRVLKPNGIAVFSTLAPGTLWELKEAWAAVDQHRHVNEFMAPECLRQIVKDAGFEQVRLDQQELVFEYDDLRELTGELKSLGAHNLNQDRPNGMTGRQRLKAFCAAYERFRTPGGKLPATWQVVYGYLVR